MFWMEKKRNNHNKLLQSYGELRLKRLLLLQIN